MTAKILLKSSAVSGIDKPLEAVDSSARILYPAHPYEFYIHRFPKTPNSLVFSGTLIVPDDPSNNTIYSETAALCQYTMCILNPINASNTYEFGLILEYSKISGSPSWILYCAYSDTDGKIYHSQPIPALKNDSVGISISHQDNLLKAKAVNYRTGMTFGLNVTPPDIKAKEANRVRIAMNQAELTNCTQMPGIATFYRINVVADQELTKLNWKFKQNTDLGCGNFHKSDGKTAFSIVIGR